MIRVLLLVVMVALIFFIFWALFRTPTKKPSRVTEPIEPLMNTSGLVCKWLRLEDTPLTVDESGIRFPLTQFRTACTGEVARGVHPVHPDECPRCRRKVLIQRTGTDEGAEGPGEEDGPWAEGWQARFPNPDAVRLEWLVAGEGRTRHAAVVTGSEQRGWSVLDQSNGLVVLSRCLPTWREAIDAAMKVSYSQQEKDGNQDDMSSPAGQKLGS